MNPNIIIFSKAIQTGKTTALLQWISKQKNVGGILTPDIQNLRNLYHIETQKYIPFEVKFPKLNDKITTIGKYNFYTEVFEQAQQLLTNATQKDYLIIDEIGRLELNQHIGLEPVLSKIIEKYNNRRVTGKLVLAIRDYLLDDCIKKYHLQEAKIVQSVAEINAPNKLIGLILAGGKSTRMQTDKAFLNYHGTEQIYYLANKIKPLCEQVFLSLNESQKTNINQQYQAIYDNATYGEIGPINALLSVQIKFPNQPIFVLACDYPFITLTDLLLLNEKFLKTNKTVTFFNSETNFREPLLGIYHQRDLVKLPEFLKNGNTSLQQFLTEIAAEKVTPLHLQNIKSVDTKADFEITKYLINK